MPQMAPFPSKGSEYREYVEAAVDLLQTNAARLKVDAAKQAALSTALADFIAAHDKATDRPNRTLLNTAAKNSTKKILTDLLRATYKELPASALTPADRTLLGLKERDHRTPPAQPTSRPRIVGIDAHYRFQNRIKYIDEETGRRAKPKSILGCEVWCAPGTVNAPPAMEDYRYVGLSITTPYLAHFGAAEAGKMMYYLLRWINTRGETGPWGDVVGAFVLP